MVVLNRYSPSPAFKIRKLVPGVDGVFFGIEGRKPGMTELTFPSQNDYNQY